MQRHQRLGLGEEISSSQSIEKTRMVAQAEDEDLMWEILEFESAETGLMVPEQSTLRKVKRDDDSDASSLADLGGLAKRLLSDARITPSITSSLVVKSLQAEEQRLAGWPRRLLHVPTLTSYEWQPGNVYCGTSNPQYNAISYTWGRWRLTPYHPRYQQTPHLCVRNIPWTIPKVDPAHFTAADFQKMLNNAAKSHSNPNMVSKYAPVEFVWVDVACIDQRQGEPRAAAEIGRQADIFSGAQAVFVWLGGLTSPELVTACRTLRSILGSSPTLPDVESLTQKSLNKVLSAFQKLLVDPWFSSLWTLQEAFLRGSDALFMSKDAQVVYLDDEIAERTDLRLTPPGRQPVVVWPRTKRITAFDLGELLDYSRTLLMYTSGLTDTSRQQTTTLWQTIAGIIRPAGLWELATGSPLSVYTAASRRQTSQQEDRIYGIEQVFRLRLGASAVNIRSGILPRSNSSHKLADLQDQLGEQLMLRYPVLSQMHVYTQPAPAGKAWRVNDNSIVPGVEEKVETEGGNYPKAPHTWVDPQQTDFPHCRLDIDVRGDQIWGQFKGRMCAFDAFWLKCQNHEDEGILHDFYRACDSNTFLHIWPDVVEELSTSPEYEGQGYHAIPSRRQRAFAGWLAKRFGAKLKVLMLGREQRWDRKGEFSNVATLPKQGQNMLGMLMLKRNKSGFSYWRRIGICKWDTDNLVIGGVPDKWKSWFDGSGKEWEIVGGIFG